MPPWAVSSGAEKREKASAISASWSGVRLCSLASLERRLVGGAAAGGLGAPRVEAGGYLRLGGWWGRS